MAQILALGDCNTLGIGELENNSYVERFAKLSEKSVQNCGFTMSSTKEMLYFVKKFLKDETEIITIQYGLVDSWKTFRYAPYVLYYPDNFLRKIARKIVKKYKKTARVLGLNRWLGEKSVVTLKTYKNNILKVIQKAPNAKIFLIDTVPNMDESRNHAIRQYNKILKEIADTHVNVYYIEVYELFLKHSEYYIEGTHLNSAGYDCMAETLFKQFQQID